jgi:hypothetical protein
MKGNSRHVKCSECKNELDTLPSNREQSSLVCSNYKCSKYAQKQMTCAANNRKFFETPSASKGYYCTSSYHRPINSRLARYSE